MEKFLEECVGCGVCVHRKVCKWKEAFNDKKVCLPDGDMIVIEIKCKAFRKQSIEIPKGVFSND